MGTGAPEGAVNKKLLAAELIVLALLLAAICFVAFLLIRNKLADQPAQQKPAQVGTPTPTLVTLVTSAKPFVLFLPFIMNSAASAPPAITVSPSTVWRFVSIDEKDIGTFENVVDPARRLTAQCKDPGRPPPNAGELYELDASGVLKPQSESKKIQRFVVITSQ